MNGATDVTNGLTLVCPTAEGVAVWHISPTLGHAAALTGAWLLEDCADLDSLTVRRILLEGREATLEGLAEFATELAATQVELDSNFDDYCAANPKKDLVRPRWTLGPIRPDLDRPKRIGTPSHMIEPLAYARWAELLLTAWADTETQRVARAFLVTRDPPVVRMYPPVWLARWTDPGMSLEGPPGTDKGAGRSSDGLMHR